MTEKLYYNDAYIKEFTATVLSVAEEGGRYSVVLDKTAFFPEEGGQTADGGVIGDITVLDVREREGVIYHYTESAVEVGSTVLCKLDFAERFMKMQCHTAEHIVSGFIKKLYGFDNVGFHLGSHDVTMDINGILTREELDRVELLVNEAVFANVPVTACFPSPEELSMIEYRSKLDVIDGVRIVKIGEYDTCACCAPHVARTGEIGLVKLLDLEKHRGGLRIHLAAGIRALYDYREKYSNVRRISALLSEPQSDTANAVERFLIAAEEQDARLKAKKLENARLEALLIAPTEKNAVCIYPDMSSEELIEFVNCAVSKVGGLLVALSGADGNYKYVIASGTFEVSRSAKDINAALNGRGGGRGAMISGAFYTDADSIKKYFEV